MKSPAAAPGTCVSCGLSAPPRFTSCCEACLATSGAQHTLACEHQPNPHLCRLEGCVKRTWNGQPNEFCSSKCKQTFETLARQAEPQAQSQPQLQPQAQVNTCLREGCSKQTWNGEPNQFCSSLCKQTFQNLANQRKVQPQVNLCLRQGCGKQTWNGKPNEFCSTLCKQTFESLARQRVVQAQPQGSQAQAKAQTQPQQQVQAQLPAQLQQQPQPFKPPEIQEPQLHPGGAVPPQPLLEAEHSEHGRVVPSQPELDKQPTRSDQLPPGRAADAQFPERAEPQPQRQFSRRQTLEASAFVRDYSRTGACANIDVFWRVVGTFLVKFIQLERTEEEARAFSERFTQGLRRDIENFDSNVPPDMVEKLRTEAPLVCVRCWTSAFTLQGDFHDKEWCAALQEGTRRDDESLFPELSQIWATMNMFCVENRVVGLHNPQGDARRVPWPMIEDVATGQRKNVLFRGGRIPEEHLDWFRRAIDNETIYRVPMAVATSTHGIKCLDFMCMYGYPQNAPKVQWIFHLDRARRCKHVNCLEKLTRLQGEQEFLLPPYSSFKPIKIDYFQNRDVGGVLENYYCIEVNIMPDNKSVSQGGSIPDDAPLAPWA